MATNYPSHKLWVIIHVISQILQNKEKKGDIDIDVTITDKDLQECINSLKITNFNFNYVKSLKKSLSIEGWKVVYKENKVLKVQKGGDVKSMLL
ncbi:hypothetical protein EZS27_027968 [termite gut metagenome]|uniref:Uncharacterized protein n=1 Tax=termite gut metagenome TaxID=433724 RepID=A0A5J4QNB1_9ZZZZ